MNRRSTRRQVLGAAGWLAVASGLAGCSGDDTGDDAGDETDDAGGDGNGTGESDDGVGETPTPVDCLDPAIEENITTDTTLGRGCTFTLGGEIRIQEGATLTVQRGVTVEATEGSLLQLDDGRVVARGTEDQPIVFRGTEDEPGHWEGIRILAEADNVLEHVQISHGGGSTFFKANLSVAAAGSDTGPPGRVAVRNCEFTDSAGAGVRASAAATLDAFENNRIANNLGEAMGLHPANIGSLDSSSTYENNGSQYVGLRWSSTAQTVTGDATWPDLGIPYRLVSANVDFIDIEGAVEMAPGTELESTSGLGVRVTSGSLVATSEDDPIVFRGVEDGQGNWEGIRVESDADNEFDNVVVSDGGGTTFYKANIRVGGRATVRNSELTDSAGWGIFLGEEGTLTAENTTFENNAEGEIRRPEE
jgi:hypothetical protein